MNEMLTWMEQHPLPFACTTNLVDRMDQASLRRFTFKITLGYLTADQVCLAYRHFFDMEAPRESRRLANLTPGDFAVVCNRLRFLTDQPSAGQIHDLLQAECAAKPGVTGAIGF